MSIIIIIINLSLCIVCDLIISLKMMNAFFQRDTNRIVEFFIENESSIMTPTDE
jgi:hypothetical protein